MKKLLITFAALLFLTAATASAQTLSATLTGAAEVPGPGDPDGSGFAIIEINGTSIRYTIVVAGIGPVTQAHIHPGAAGVAGPVLITLTESGQLSGTATATQTQINQILANPGGFYVNVHNAEFSAGAVRGQLVSPAGSGIGSRTQYLPVVAKVAGAAGTNFVTDIRIINQGSATANVTLDYFQQSTAGQTAPTATRTVTVLAGQQAVIDDLIGTLSASGLGGLRVTSDQPVSVVARVINDQRAAGQGTTGFSVEALELSEAKTSGTIGFLSNNSTADIGAGVGFRTNVGYFNPSATPVTVTLTARRTSDGTALGTSTITVPGFSQVQGSVFSSLMIDTVASGDQVQPNFYVTYTAPAPLFVYGSVVDNRTGDSVLIQ